MPVSSFGKPPVVPTTIVVAASDSKDPTRADYKCDGVNDEEEINAAINTLPPAGGKVVLLEGTYNIGSSITILKSNVTLEGSGPGTKLFLVNGANTHVIRVGNGSTSLNNIKISNLQIDGNKTNQTGISHGIYFYGGLGYLITDSIVEKCWIRNIRDSGIRLEYCNKVIITKNIVPSAVYGIYTYTCSAVTIAENTIYSSGSTGIFLSFSGNSVVSGNICLSNNSYGIRISGTGGTNNTIVGNIVGNNTYGIYLFNVSNNTVTGNTIFSSYWSGIYLTNNSGNIVTGNLIKDSSTASNNSYDDIFLNGASNNIISNNVIISTASNKSRYAVNEQNSDYNIVIGNYCSGQVTGKINLSGANSEMGHNIEV